MQNCSYENNFDLHENELVGETRFDQWFCAKTRFDSEAQCSSEMANQSSSDNSSNQTVIFIFNKQR